MELRLQVEEGQELALAMGELCHGWSPQWITSFRRKRPGPAHRIGVPRKRCGRTLRTLVAPVKLIGAGLCKASQLVLYTIALVTVKVEAGSFPLADVEFKLPFLLAVAAEAREFECRLSVTGPVVREALVLAEVLRPVVLG